jgi:putative ABC transport system permease protein
MIRYVLRNLARRRTRAVAGILGILTTVALLTAIQIGLDSISLSYVELASLQAGKADLVISARDGEFFAPEGFDPAPALAKLKDQPHLRGLAPRLVGFAQIADAHFVYLLGIDPARERDLDILGFSPEPQLGPDACAVSESVARRAGLAVGASVPLSASTRCTLRVRGIIERQLVFPQQLLDYVVVDEATARKLLDEPTNVHALAGALDDPRAFYDARDLTASVRRLRRVGDGAAERLGPDYAVRLPKAAAITFFQHVSAPVRAGFGVFAVLALAVTGLLIYSLVSVGVEERIREFAILRTLGGRRRHVFGLVLLESLILCFMGVAPGAFGGLLLARAVLWLVEAAAGAGADPIRLSLSPTTAALCLGAGAVLAVASSLAPALAACRRRIADAIDPLRRGALPTEPPPEGGALRALLWTGLALSAISVVVFFILPGAFLSGDPSLIGVVVLGLLMTILLGFTLMGLGAMPWVERAVLAAAGLALGPAAEMARRNLARHRRRHLTTSLMFTLSVSFVLFIASLVALFSRTSQAMLEQVNGADIRIMIWDPRGKGDEVHAQLGAVEGVRGITRAVELRHRTRAGVAYDVAIGDLVGMRSLWIRAFGTDPGFIDVIYAPLVRYEEGDAGAFAQLAADTGQEDDDPPLILSRSAAAALDVHAGDLLNVTFQLGSHRHEARFRIAAICGAVPGFSNFNSRVASAVGSGVMMSLPRLTAMVRAAGLEAAQEQEAFHTLYLIRAGERQRDVANRIREQYAARYRFGVESTLEQRQTAEVLYWATQLLFGVLLGVAVMIAVFSLIASMATTVSERRWEIGVLKAVGVRRGQLFRLFLGEAVVLTLSAGLAGAVIGFVLAYLFVLQAATLGEMPVVFTLPYLTLAATLAVSVLAALIAAYLPTRRLLGRTAAEIFRLVE